MLWIDSCRRGAELIEEAKVVSAHLAAAAREERGDRLAGALVVHSRVVRLLQRSLLGLEPEPAEHREHRGVVVVDRLAAELGMHRLVEVVREHPPPDSVAR